MIDAGLKALAFDFGPPLVREGAASDEHGGLGISGATYRLNIGDKARLIPSPAEEDASPS
jgi:hypothetical protein